MRILIAQRLGDPDGRYAGVLVAGMAPDFVLQVLVDPTLYPSKDVRLFLDNGKLLAVHRDGAEWIGENFAEHLLFSQSARAGLPQWGVLPDPFDDEPEIAALQKVEGLPFLVSVTTSYGPQLVGWWYRTAFLLGYAAVSLGGTVFFLLKGLLAPRDPPATTGPAPAPASDIEP